MKLWVCSDALVMPCSTEMQEAGLRLSLLDRLVVHRVELDAVDLLAGEERSLARIRDLDLLQHLANDHLDVLVVDLHALQTVDLLDFIHQELEALREERFSDHETRAVAIRSAMTGLKCDAVASALPGQRTFLRMLSMPATAAKQLSSVLSFEVESTLPFELDDAVMDHRLLRRIEGVDAADQLPIMAGVAYTEEVRDHIGLVLRGTGHEPQRVGIGPLPITNLGQVIPELQRDMVAVLDLDDHHADLVILRQGEPRFSRCLSRGVSGLPADAAVIARELRQSIGAWRMQGGPKVEALYVIGAGRETPGLQGFVDAQLNVPIVDLPRPSLEGMTPDMLDRMPRFAKAISLALSLSRRATDLNLRQGPLEAQQSFQFVRDKTPLLAGLAAAIFVSFGFSVFAEMQALDSERESLQRQLEVATQAHFGEKTTDPKVANELLEAAITGKTADPLPKIDAFDVMVVVSEKIPKEIVHDISLYEYNRGDVTIEGVVPDIKDADVIKDNLAEHECFKELKKGKTRQLKGQDKYKYTLEFKANCKAESSDKKKKKKKDDKKEEDKK